MAHDTLPSTTVAVLLLVQLRVWPGNPRKTVGDLADLAASIKEHGILEPLLVRPLAGVEGITHEIVAGQRRYLAARTAGSDAAPCIVREMGDAEALEIGLIENGQRVDPSPLEDAIAMNALIVDHGRSIEQIVDKLGRDKRYVQRRLALLGLIDTAREWLLSGRLSLAHAQQLAVVDASVQQTVINQYAQADDLPPSKVFARDIARALHPLVAAPFDINDASMPGGPCGPCPHRSDTQPDLFGPADNERCLKSSCWDAKVAHVWEKAQRGARRRHLAVINEPVIVGLNDTVTGTSYVTKGADGAKPVAVGRTYSGHVHELFERPVVVPAPAPTKLAPVEDDEESEASIAARQKRREEARKAQQEAEETRKRAILLQLTTVASTPEGLVLVQRVALLSMLREWSAGGDLRGVCEALGMPAFGPSVDLVADVSDALIGRVLAATVAAAWALDPDAEDDEQPERRLRALLNGTETLSFSVPRCGDCDQVEAIAKQSQALTRCFCGRTYGPTVVATGAEVAEELQRLGREHGITGEVADAMCREIGDPVSETATHRVLIVPDGGWSKHVKGLGGFSAEKTSSAGSLSGGACRPLRLVFTATGHPEVVTLLARLNAAKVPYLDLGDATLSEVYGCTPANRSVREHWNEDHPTRPVTTGDGEPGWATASTSEDTSARLVGTAPATCVWITEKVWDKLTDDQQGMLSTPDVTTEEVVWEGREGHVMAVVRDAKTLGALQHVLREHKVKHRVLFEGENVETKRAKKAVKT